jgi:hypothetical protein
MAAHVPLDDDDTVRARLPSVAEITLEAVFDTLERVEPSPRERELRTRAEGFRLAMANRVTIPPTPTQRRVMRELVSALHESVVSSVEGGRLRARRS